ncbi:YfhO family protein [Thalassobacillus sp. CUG 92003]|uniref:YfhO family protein n=1 Tax=Thalassobacillus sp. CUG 92003 TaxID=2736641 RepID=UPI0015E6AC2F|nr:YfhO family protein [Thalassobacillus sp. CUG 92003]
MRKKQTILLLIAASLLVSVLSHLYFIIETLQNNYMVDTYDGMNQVLPFKQLLYEQYTNGNFFYSFHLGLGGDTYSQLSYYYSTNILFLATIPFVYLLELAGIVDSPDALFWAESIVWVSIFRLALLITVTTCVFWYMNLHKLSSFLGAVLFGASAIYFRHVAHWEFFSDAYVWLPLLVVGVEKIIRERKPGWFIFAVAAMLFNNFYFAYIHFIFIGIYILFRWFIPFEKNEAGKLQQLKQYSIGGGLGFGIGSLSFIPALFAYFNNYRPPYQVPIPFFDLSDNILLDSHYLLIPTIALLFLFMRGMYKHRAFRLFAGMALLFVLFHYSPKMASVFNGFSAPRYRFENTIAFLIGGAVAVGLPLLKQVKARQLWVAALCTALAYTVYVVGDPTYDLTHWRDMLILIQAVAIFAGVLLLVYFPGRNMLVGLVLLVIAGNTAVMNHYHEKTLNREGYIAKVTKDYMEDENYMNAEQTELVRRVQSSYESPLPRMEWVANDRNNTPLVQDFRGISLFSSLINENMLFFYYHDLEIDMKQESTSRYSGFGDRANLYSFTNTRYIMYEKGEDRNVPYGFEPMMESDHYEVYQNTNKLPFVRTQSEVYSEQALEDHSFVTREHAMLDGLVLEDPVQSSAQSDRQEDLMEGASIEPVNAGYKDGQLNVTGETGGIDINVNNPPEDVVDFYVSFHLTNNNKEAPWFPLHVNDFETSRKSFQSLYRTGVNDLTIRIPKDETISIRVPEGSYTLDELAVYGESYQTLERVSAEDKEPKADVEWGGHSITLDFNNTENEDFVTIPVPYEKGWRVKVNGEEQEVKKANYAFVATKIEEGHNRVEFTYFPPYLKWSALLALISAVLALFWLFKLKPDKR